jgi:hypothetical protein
VIPSLERRPFALFLALYAGIALLAWAVPLVMPEPIMHAVADLTGASGLGLLDPAVLGRRDVVAPLPGAPMWAVAAVAMTAAGVLGLPVAWLYTITRQKRGYRQSLVHTLVLLPVVVAGVVVLVKHSLALAFSLAGIVAAVRFRHTLEDSKDSVYVFVATGVGLAAGVELSVAAALSVVFNLVILLLFRSDFGRTPARLEGEMAEQRLQRALAVANRTSQFVARLDNEILKAMAPEQLEALADRAWRRRKEAAAGEPESEEADEYGTILVVTTGDVSRAREVVEPLLSRRAKRWRFGAADVQPDGAQRIQYALKLKKSVSPTAFVEELRAEGAAHLKDVELR